MRKWLQALLLVLFLLPSCEKEPFPSYVGTWRYASSEPDLGPAYEQSWVMVNRAWAYTIYDAPTGLLYVGDSEDFRTHGQEVALTVGSGDKSRTFVCRVLRLKGGELVGETESLTGVTTRIRFVRISKGFKYPDGWLDALAG